MVGQPILCVCGWEYDSGQQSHCPNCLHGLRPVFDLEVLLPVPAADAGAAQFVRPAWDEIWMGLAEHLAKRSTCRRLSVGCVVVSEDNSCVLGIGYNGSAKGLNNDCVSDEPGQCGHLHAEINALLKTNTRDAAKKKAYITTEPCYLCAVALVNAGIQEVVFRNEYRKHEGVALLASAGIKVRRLP